MSRRALTLVCTYSCLFATTSSDSCAFTSGSRNRAAAGTGLVEGQCRSMGNDIGKVYRNGQADILGLARHMMTQEPVHDILRQVPPLSYKSPHLCMGHARFTLLCCKVLKRRHGGEITRGISPLEENDLSEVMEQAERVEGVPSIVSKQGANPLRQVRHHEGVFPEQHPLLRRYPVHDLMHGNGEGQVYDLVIAQYHHRMLHRNDLPTEPIEGRVHHLQQSGREHGILFYDPCHARSRRHGVCRHLDDFPGYGRQREEVLKGPEFPQRRLRKLAFSLKLLPVVPTLYESREFPIRTRPCL